MDNVLLFGIHLNSFTPTVARFEENSASYSSAFRNTSSTRILSNGHATFLAKAGMEVRIGRRPVIELTTYINEKGRRAHEVTFDVIKRILLTNVINGVRL